MLILVSLSLLVNIVDIIDIQKSILHNVVPYLQIAQWDDFVRKQYDIILLFFYLTNDFLLMKQIIMFVYPFGQIS